MTIASLKNNAWPGVNSKSFACFKLLDSFEDQGNERYLEAVKRASPVARENISFRGTYTFAQTGELPKLEELMAPIEGYQPISER